MYYDVVERQAHRPSPRLGLEWMKPQVAHR
ncbi:hypothetical protein NFI96_029083, partial [Prochilodus magdalenae]